MKLRYTHFIIGLLIGAVILTVYLPWFTTGEIIGGDWPYFYGEMIKEQTLLPPLWTSQGGLWLGGVNASFSLFSYQYFISSLFVNVFGIPWVFVYKIFWFGLFILLSIFSISYFAKTIFKKLSFFIFPAILLYVANTYILMVVGGGQMGIALAYSIAPLVLARFIKLIQNSAFAPSSGRGEFRIQNSILTGLVLALQIMFDIRIAYITLFIVVLYALIHYFFIKRFSFKFIIRSSLFIILLVVGLHSYWLFPFVAFNLFSIPGGVTSPLGFEFFSFADFSHTLSMLHPNWPENIFGKTYFLQPEFLILPILAYSSLIFISKIKNQKSKIQVKYQNLQDSDYSSSEVRQLADESRSFIEESSRPIRQAQDKQARTIIFFCVLGLFGAFLTKGVNPPFGEVNQWLFQYIPGMNMFRDPTKFYIMTALSYSILIPFSMYSIYELLNSKFPSARAQGEGKIQNYLPNLFLLLVTGYLLFLFRPAWTGELTGTFKERSVPREYIELKDFIVSQPDFFRTLWVPTQSRFRFQSENHPLLNADTLFKTSSPSAIVKKLHADETRSLLEKLSVKYVIIPYDATEEIFLEDRSYDQSKRLAVENGVDTISWLKKIQTGTIAIYEMPTYRDHFFSQRLTSLWLGLEGEESLSYKRINSSRYELSIDVPSETTLVFSEAYHPSWKAMFQRSKLDSKETAEGLNSFLVPRGEYKLQVYFEPQQYAKYTYLFSLALLTVLVVPLLKARSDQ